MKRKILSMFIVITAVMSFAGVMPVTVKTENAPIKLGACVQMGIYDINGDGTAEPILWRCVAFEKIMGTDKDGNPITDSTDTVTAYRDGYLPLMIADTSICKKAFDAPGDNTNASHGRSEQRPARGSNYWDDSNIRDWLNSAEKNVAYTCGNKPLYSDEAGFLSNFTAEEKAVMTTVTQKSILSEYDKDIANTSGTELHKYNNSVSEVVQNYKNSYSEQFTDTMFLLDVQQVKNIYDNCGDYYEPYGSTLYYWLRTPNAKLDYLTRIAFSSGEVNEYIVESSKVGVRPAFYLNPSAVLYGEGSRYYPHMVVPTHTHYMSAEYNYENAVTFDKELTLEDGKLCVDGEAIECVTEGNASYINLPAGNYCLADNISIADNIKIQGQVNLCLNGKTLDMGESGIEVVGETGIFGLCDCGNDGVITSSYHNGSPDSALITSRENSVFTLYRGKVVNTSDRQYSYKQAISAVDGAVKLYGGEITAKDDNAVYFGEQAVGVTLSGAVKIKGSSDRADIYLRNIGVDRLLTINAPLTNTEPYRIGAMRNEVFTDGWNKHMPEGSVSDYFVSAERGSCIGRNDSGELEIYAYAISEQPSEENGHTVTVNGTPVSYTWYPAEVIAADVTDNNAAAYEYNSQRSVYDSEKGWDGVFDKNMNKSYFKISLSEGEILKVKTSAPLEEFSMVSLADAVSGEFQDISNPNSEGEYAYTAETDSEYVLSVVGTREMDYPNVTATTVKTVLGSAVEGQTSNKFTGSSGSYLCEITCADGTVLRSDVVDYEAPSPSPDPSVSPSVSPSPVPDENAECVKITAEYSENGTLLSVSIETVKLSEIVPEPNTETRKVFYWESLEKMQPVSILN